MPRIQAILSRMAGEIPVYINLPQEGITLLCPRPMWVKDARQAQAALRGEVGEADMKVVRKA